MRHIITVLSILFVVVSCTPRPRLMLPEDWQDQFIAKFKEQYVGQDIYLCRPGCTDGVGCSILAGIPVPDGKEKIYLAFSVNNRYYNSGKEGNVWSDLIDIDREEQSSPSDEMRYIMGENRKWYARAREDGECLAVTVR